MVPNCERKRHYRLNCTGLYSDRVPTVAPSREQANVSQSDWLRVAIDVLRREGIEKVRVLSLAQELGVARSGFYWHFGSREQLLAALLVVWSERNTASIVKHARRSEPTITAAVLGIFECWSDSGEFDAALDLAVREWARTDRSVDAQVRAADDMRLAALRRMYARHGFPDAPVRARVLYFTQIGYYALRLEESMSQRLRHVADYVRVLTGHDPSASELHHFAQSLKSTATARPNR